MELLTVKNLSFTYPNCARPTLSDISFSVKRGDFVAVCGATGSGKTTLLRRLKREIAPLGDACGEILFKGTPTQQLDPIVSARAIGYVMQRPEQQIVTDKVWHELAYGLESTGTDRQTIRRRVSEIAAFFGIEEWFERDTDSLSGGQKQLLNLAAVMVTAPDILILDEPTAQLDPIAAAEFLSALRRLNSELALTIIIAEHRLEDIIPMSNALLVMDNGRIAAFGETRTTADRLCWGEHIPQIMPTAVRLYHTLGKKSQSGCPLSVSEGRDFIEESFKNDIRALPANEYSHSPDIALQFSEAFFRYSRSAPDVLRGLDLTIYCGESFFILGGNGSGKTTALCAAAGLLKIYSGQIRIFGRKISEYKNQSLYTNCVAMLPQDAQTLFLHSTVREELSECYPERNIPFRLERLLDMHPYDLSGGEQQLLGLAKALACDPKLLLLDEPTKGLDADSKQLIKHAMNELRARGVTTVTVTHDMEFAASCADRCALFFRGEITSIGTAREFFCGNSFYTTTANRMTRGHYDNAVTFDDVVRLCTLNGRSGV